MNYIVLDLEWNQCPYGKDREDPRLPFEILEIGAVKMTGEKEIADTFNETICPVVYKQLHFRTREIVDYQMEDLKKSRKFPEVIRDFFSWCGEDYILCTWGPSDLPELQRNLDYYGLENPLPKPLIYYDVQKLFSILYEDGKVSIICISKQIWRINGNGPDRDENQPARRMERTGEQSPVGNSGRGAAAGTAAQAGV